jgi:hypothetical protein
MQLKAKNPKTNFTDVCPDDVVNAQFQIAGTTYSQKCTESAFVKHFKRQGVSAITPRSKKHLQASVLLKDEDCVNLTKTKACRQLDCPKFHRFVCSILGALFEERD